MSDPDICIYCQHFWQAGHSLDCPQETNVYPVTHAENNIVCASCHETLGEFWTSCGGVIHCLGCAARLVLI